MSFFCLVICISVSSKSILITSTFYPVCSVQFSRSVMSDSLGPHGLQHARLPCPSPTPGVCSNSCPSSGWCHPTISSSAIPFSSCLQSFPASGSFLMSQFFPSGGQSIGASTSASASVLLMNIQDWFPLGFTGLISLQSKGLLSVQPPSYTNQTKKELIGYIFIAHSLLYSEVKKCWALEPVNLSLASV